MRRINMQNGENRKSLEIDEDFTVEELKNQAFKEWQIPTDEQKILFMGKILKNREKILEANKHGVDRGNSQKLRNTGSIKFFFKKTQKGFCKFGGKKKKKKKKK